MLAFTQQHSQVEFDTSLAVGAELVDLHVWATVTGELTDEGAVYTAEIERIEPMRKNVLRRDRAMLEGEAIDVHLGRYRTKTMRLGNVVLGDEIERRAA
ncbi:hypothetical protein [Pararobbsia alpina]|uniref:Uncharacterized protein n=1 Tax=Pararobbsia alpina TaxID=621374 RepID=A0A6S7B230_9BURK|nr:hypothetical protein [Pararobbsia alpina]CAB3784588.1 hypothetical protein LMG28138_01839 [Pararobbsia alpina]